MRSKSQVKGLSVIREKTLPVMRLWEKERMSVNVHTFVFTVGKVRSSTESKKNWKQKADDSVEC